MRRPVWSRRCGVAVAAVAAAVVLPAGVASADPAGPTDYEARVVGVAPTDPAATVPSGVGLTVEGHDSFLWLRLLPGMTAEVPGYDGEPYLRIDADGSVHRNRLSWSTWYNEDRFGDVERPDFVDPAASPDWELIDDDSSVAWHDHRIHLMDPVPPIGAEPGDVVLTSVVPVTVDGVDLEVRVETTLVAGPSARPMLGGLMIGVAVVAAFVVFGGRRIGAVTVMASTAGLVALVVGGVQYLSQPIDTGPDRLWVAVPLAGLLAGLIGVVLERSGRWFWATGSAVVTGAMVGWWFLGRWSVFTSALIPTALPGSVDRLSTAAVGVVAAAVVIGSIGVLVRPGPVPGSADERSEPVA